MIYLKYETNHAIISDCIEICDVHEGVYKSEEETSQKVHLPYKTNLAIEPSIFHKPHVLLAYRLQMRYTEKEI